MTLLRSLTPQTQHLVHEERLGCMKTGAMLINTGRGALIDTQAVVDALKSGKLGYLGLDVYKEKEGIFFEDFSNPVMRDDVFARLSTFPNVLITWHQVFLTNEALDAIASTRLDNLTAFEKKHVLRNQVTRLKSASPT